MITRERETGMPRRRSAAVRAQAAFLAGVALVACGCSATAANGTANGTTNRALAPITSEEFDALYRARMDSARAVFTQADVGFMSGMIAHHAQALVMCAWAPTNGASSQVQTLCARIINSQQDEIDRMQQWLRDRGQPVPEVRIHGEEMMIHGMEHHMMPGMLTDVQMDELGATRGRDFDRLFLESMIRHHDGALTMVEELIAVDGAAQGSEAFKLASDINADQTTEIARMEGMLAEITESATGR